MEKELNLDQEVITINVSEENLTDPTPNDESLSDEDYTVEDESDIDWSVL